MDKKEARAKALEPQFNIIPNPDGKPLVIKEVEPAEHRKVTKPEDGSEIAPKKPRKAG